MGAGGGGVGGTGVGGATADDQPAVYSTRVGQATIGAGAAYKLHEKFATPVARQCTKTSHASKARQRAQQKEALGEGTTFEILWVASCQHLPSGIESEAHAAGGDSSATPATA